MSLYFKKYSGWILAWILLAIPAGVLIRTFVLSRLWFYFLSRQYGTGPTMGGWFGLSVISTLMTVSLAKEKKNEADGLDVVKDTLKFWAGQLIILGAALGVGSMFEWVR